MTNIDNLNPHITRSAAHNLGWQWDTDEPIEPYLDRLRALTPRQVFDQYCGSYGLGWLSDMLWETVAELQEAEEQR